MNHTKKDHPRGGLRICGFRGHQEVRSCFVRFARWLRKEWKFPVRVNVYLSPRSLLIARDGDTCAGLIWIPDDPQEMPAIRVATGDYELEKKTLGRDNALAGYLSTLCHELIHYKQWLETDGMWEKGVARKAIAMVDRYAQTTDHP